MGYQKYIEDIEYQFKLETLLGMLEKQLSSANWLSLTVPLCRAITNAGTWNINYRTGLKAHFTWPFLKNNSIWLKQNVRVELRKLDSSCSSSHIHVHLMAGIEYANSCIIGLILELRSTIMTENLHCNLQKMSII